MPVYQGNQSIGDLNYQEQNIVEGYYGNIKVYEKNQIPLTNNLEAYYRFESSNRWGDSSGKGRNLSPFGAAVSNTIGKIGDTFNTSSSQHTGARSTNSIFSNIYEFSVSCWINCWNYPSNIPSICGNSQQYPTEFNWELTTRYSGRYIELMTDSPRVYYRLSNSLITLNTWYHIVFTIKDNTLTGYFNGNLERITNNINLNYMGKEYGYFVVNGEYANVGVFPGLIDEVCYWSRELTANDVKRLYNNGNGIIIQ